MCTILKLLQIWQNLFLHICCVLKSEISPHDQFFSPPTYRWSRWQISGMLSPLCALQALHILCPIDSLHPLCNLLPPSSPLPPCPIRPLFSTRPILLHPYHYMISFTSGANSFRSAKLHPKRVTKKVARIWELFLGISSSSITGSSAIGPVHQWWGCKVVAATFVFSLMDETFTLAVVHSPLTSNRNCSPHCRHIAVAAKSNFIQDCALL